MHTYWNLHMSSLIGHMISKGRSNSTLIDQGWNVRMCKWKTLSLACHVLVRLWWAGWRAGNIAFAGHEQIIDGSFDLLLLPLTLHYIVAHNNSFIFLDTNKGLVAIHGSLPYTILNWHFWPPKLGWKRSQSFLPSYIERIILPEVERPKSTPKWFLLISTCSLFSKTWFWGFEDLVQLVYQPVSINP